MRQAAVILAGLLLWGPVGAQAGEAFQNLAGNVYVRIVSPDSNAVANSGFVVLDQSVLVFDTHFTPEAGRELREKIREVTAKPVRYVVNSHGHPDHTHGNQLFPDAHLIGSQNARLDVEQKDIPSWKHSVAESETLLKKLRRQLKEASSPAAQNAVREDIRAREDYMRAMSHLNIRSPFVTFEDRLDICDGPEELRLLYLGAGHTNGDIVLFLPGEKIVFAGDLFFHRAIPNVQDASVLAWMDTIEKLLQLEAETFIPGHGPVGSRSDLREFLTYFRDLRSRVQEALERGDSMQQTVAALKVPEKYASYGFQNFFPANVQKMYVELKERLQNPASVKTAAQE